MTRRRRVATTAACNTWPNQTKFLSQHELTRYNSAHYGLWLSFNHLDYSCRSCHRRDRKAADAGSGSRRLHRYDFAWHRRRIGWHLGRSNLCRRELRRRLDHVDCRRHDPVAAVSVAFQTEAVESAGILPADLFCPISPGSENKSCPATCRTERAECRRSP